MKKIFTIVAAMLTTIGLMATQHEVEDANGLSWWTAEANVNDGDTLVFTADTIEWAYDITLPCALTFINKEGVNPVLVMPAKFKVSHALEIKGLTFIGNGGNDVFRFTAGTGYSAKFDGCTFKNFHYGIRIYDAAVQLEQLTINNCLFDGYDASAINAVAGSTAPGTVKNVSITNSTIMNGGSSYAIYICDNDVSASTDGPSVTIDHCTLYNNATNSYTIYLYKIGPQAHISNCVVANPSTSQASYAYYGYDGNFVDNCVWYNCSSGARSGSVKTNLTNADPLFTDAANMDFSFKAGSPALTAASDGGAIGDPRWVNSEEEEDEPIAITVDGNASDWAGIPMLTEPGTYPIIRAIPASGFMANTLAMYYMYEDTANFASGDFPQLYVDADSNPETGTKLGSAYVNFGYDYSFTSGYGSWTSFNMKTSDHVMEIAIDKAAMPTAVVPFNAQFRWLNSGWTEYWCFPLMPDKYDWSFGEGAFHPATIKNFQIDDFEGTHTAENSYARFAYMPTSNPADFGANNTSKDTLAWISWPVRISKGGVYTVTADLESDNVVSCDLYLYDMASNQLVKKYTSAQTTITGSWKVGNWDLGNVPEGKYMLVVKNHVSHSHMKLNSVTLTYAGGAVVDLPATLLPADAILSEKAFIENDTIFFAPRGVEGYTPDGWAKWNVNVTEKAKYLFKANCLKNNNMSIKIAVIDAENDTIYHPEAKKLSGSGDIEADLGSVILEAGAYVILMQDTIEFSNGSLKSVVVTKEDLPAEITISEDATNNALLTENLDKTVNVSLVRSMPIGMFSTFCLPFPLSSSQIANSQFAGAEIYYLDRTAVQGDEVVLYFEKSSDIYQGTPYIIMPATAVENPAFEGVTIKKDEASSTYHEGMSAVFRGTFVQKHLTAGNENLLYLGQNNLLYFPEAGDESCMKGLRGYFEILQDSKAPIRRASIRMGSNVVTTLDFVDGQAVPNGVFMLNGQIEIRVNGQKYMLNGMQK